MDNKNLPVFERAFFRCPEFYQGWKKGFKNRFCFFGLATLLFFFIPPSIVQCEKIPWSGENFFHISEEQPVRSLLKDIFLNEGVLANISESVADTPVSGKFNQPADQVFRRITSAFNLIWYYDGQVVYIYPANKMESKTIAVKHVSMRKVKKSMHSMGITDSKYPLRYYNKERIVMVHGPEIYVKRISDAMKSIDVYRRRSTSAASAGQSGGQNVRIFRLKHAWAADRRLQIGDRNITIQGVASILKGVTNQKNSQDLNSYTATRVTKVREASAPRADEGQKESPSPLVNYMPESEHTIQCADRLNAVIVHADPANMAYYEKMISELDVPLQLIEIKASIIDVDSEAMSSIGLDLGGEHREGDRSYFYDTNVIPPSNPLFDLKKIPTGSFGGLSFSAIIGDLADDYFTLRLKALESKGKAKIMSKPSIITFDNIEARFTNTETFYVRVTASEDASLYEISVGIVLKVTPHLIFEEHKPKIKLLISIEDGNIMPLEVDEIPVVEKSTINTQAVVGGKESLLIGGLTHDTKKEVLRKVPLLGDIPLLGNLFRSKDKINSKSERLFLISPRILNVDGNANIIAQESESKRPRAVYRNWPPVKLYETTF